MKAFFNEIGFVDLVFNTAKTLEKITLPNLFTPLLKAEFSPEQTHWAKRNIASALTVLEKLKLISGQPTVRFTENLRVPIDGREATISFFGKMLPGFIRLMLIGFYLIRKKITIVLGVLAAINLCRNAYLGFAILGTAVDYISAFVLLVFLAFNLKKSQ